MKYLFAVTHTNGSPADVTICKSKRAAVNLMDFVRTQQRRGVEGGASFVNCDDLIAVAYPDGTRYEVQPYTDEAYAEYFKKSNAARSADVNPVKDNFILWRGAKRVGEMYGTGVAAFKEFADFAELEARALAHLAAGSSERGECPKGCPFAGIIHKHIHDEILVLDDPHIDSKPTAEPVKNYVCRVEPHQDRIILDGVYYSVDTIRTLLARRTSWGGTPIPMILHCPNCGEQHIDRDESKDGQCGKLYSTAMINGIGSLFCEKSQDHQGNCGMIAAPWKNPPHRSHKCRVCNHIWRPCDFETVGVQNINTRGKADTVDNTKGGPYRLPAAFMTANRSVFDMLLNQLSAAEELVCLDIHDMKKLNTSGIERVVQLADRIHRIRIAVDSLDGEIRDEQEPKK
jgi:hypothetical protein